MNPTCRTSSPYSGLISEAAAEIGETEMDPRHVEAFMRLEHRTLDALTPEEFRYEVAVAIEAIAMGFHAEPLAVSFGL